MKRTVPIAFTVVACGVAGTALALTGDLWDGSARISTGGAAIFTGAGYSVPAPPVYVYNKTITFTLTKSRAGGPTYTIEATGRLFGNQQFIGAYGQEVTQAFGFRGSARLKDAAGTVLCTGPLVVGGRWDGDSFGELRLPKTCPEFGRQQYLSFQARLDRTSIDNVAMLQR